MILADELEPSGRSPCAARAAPAPPAAPAWRLSAALARDRARAATGGGEYGLRVRDLVCAGHQDASAGPDAIGPGDLASQRTVRERAAHLHLHAVAAPDAVLTTQRAERCSVRLRSEGAARRGAGVRSLRPARLCPHAARLRCRVDYRLCWLDVGRSSVVDMFGGAIGKPAVPAAGLTGLVFRHIVINVPLVGHVRPPACARSSHLPLRADTSCGRPTPQERMTKTRSSQHDPIVV